MAGGSGSLSRLLVLGVVFHAAYVLSIFDIYFTSPVVPRIESAAYASASLPPPARRVVVFVADGCRADKFFEVNATASSATTTTTNNNEAAAERVPFLRRMMLERGSWGVSHTRVPTESRPGHVALFAGMYEDVSAVTKGWQDNPVDFDSVFNQSAAAFLLGSPDIVPMFARRVQHAHEWHYSHEEEDFARADASQLDVWVFNKLQQLFSKARGAAEASSNNPEDREAVELNEQLRNDRVVIFCHLLGIDSNGHAHRPNSHDYLNNIALVDELVEKTYRLVEDFFDYDERTAYVFTADHGMSLKGAHGDGDPANTRTPLVAWGAGVQRPTKASSDGKAAAFDIDLPTQSRLQVQAQLSAQRVQEEEAARDWGALVQFVRKDVMQADVAPLISALLGVPYPRNSVGVLPFSFLAQGKYRARAVMFNAQQLYLHARRKEQEKEARTLLFFRAFAPFRDRVPTLSSDIRELWDRVESFEQGDEMTLAEIEAKSQEMIDVCLAALEYFQRYDWFFLLSIIVVGYVGWMLVVAIAYLHPSRFQLRQLVTGGPGGDASRLAFVGFATATYLALESSPLTYYLYVSFPLAFWNFVWTNSALLPAFSSQQSGPKQRSWWMDVLLIVASLELVVFGYERRAIFGALFTLLGVWSLFVEKPQEHDHDDEHRHRRWQWAGSCVLLSVFPYLPSEYGEHTALVLVGGAVVLALPHVVRRYLAGYDNSNWTNRTFDSQWVAASVPLALALMALVATMAFLDSKSKPPVPLTLANWALAIGPVANLLAQLYRNRTVASISTAENAVQVAVDRLLRVVLALAPSFVLLSISYEVLFYAALSCVLVTWVVRESSSQKPAAANGWGEIRRAFLFLLFVKIAFFGTGNVASMSSFEISSTYRFVTVFAPFTMGALLVLKILVPFLLVACAFHLALALQPAPRLAPARYFLLVVAMSDVLALHFLFLVQNEGSWKQIGNSISMFGIVNAQIVFIPLLFLLASAFVRDLVDDRDAHNGKKSL